MRTNTKKLLALVLVAVMVASAGCAGWGTDGPADSNDGEQNDGADDLNQTQNETNQSNTTTGSGTSDSSDSTSSDDSDGTSSDGSGESSDDSSSSGDDTPSSQSDSKDSSESDSATGSSDSNSGGQSGEDGDADGSDGDTSDGDGDSSSGDPSAPDSNNGDDTNEEDNTNDNTNGNENEGENETPSDPDDPAPDEGNTVTIDVRHLDTDEPVDIPVRLNGLGHDYDETKTATGGTATFENVPDGEYEVKEAADGWWPEVATANEFTVSGDTSYTLGVRDAPDTHTLTVTVTDAETGEPIEGVEIDGVGDRHPDGGDMLMGGTTNENGVMTKEVYESGYDVSIQAEGYEPQTDSFGVDSDTELSYELAPEDEGEEQGPANAIDVDSVKHAGAEPFTDYDRVTLVNTHSELPLDVSGWSISTSDQTPEMPIGDVVIGPGETHEVILDAEEKMLTASGGVLEIYTDDGSKVMEWNYVGSPSNPGMPPEEPNESGNVNETNTTQAAAV